MHMQIKKTVLLAKAIGSMRIAKLKKVFQDEIRESCLQCGVERLMAYWDEELEYYIYLSDTDICNNCHSAIN